MVVQLVFCFVAINGSGQDESLPIIHADVKMGKTIDIHPFFPEVSSGFNAELRMGWLTNGRKRWHHFYHYPESGVSLSFSDLGNKTILGNAISLMPYIDTRQIWFSRKAVLNVRGGLGLAYFTNPFDAVTNPDNYVIGSRITASVALSASFVRYIGQWRVNAGFSFWHYSNGHFAVPNIGANIPYLSLGVSKKLSTKQIKISMADTLYLHTGIRLNAEMNLGGHEVEGTILPFDGPRYSVYGGKLTLSKRLNFKSRVRFGMGYSYYNAFHDYIVSQEIFSEKIHWRSSKLILIAGHEFVFGRLTILSDLGFNLHYPLKAEMVRLELIKDRTLHALMTAEIGFNYYFKDISEKSRNTPFLGVGLRSMGATADFVLTRIGYVF